MNRRVEPEWLDELPGDDPRAVQARRDLRILNRVMGHAGSIRRTLSARLRQERVRIAELGAGDGTLLLRMCARTAHWRGGEVVLVDRQPVVSPDTVAGYRARNYSLTTAASDVFDWLGQETGAYDAIVANLFLHHFEASQLGRLFALAAARTPLFVACEPRRARFALAGSRLLGLIGRNDVTRHDAVLSVRAGFSRSELSELWPIAEGWTLEERRAGLFSHLFSAQKRDS